MEKAQLEAPRLAVEHAEEDSEQFKEIRVQLRDGPKVVAARMHFVVIKNLNGPSIQGMEASYRVRNCVSRKILHPYGPFLFIFSISSDHLTIHHEKKSLQEFVAFGKVPITEAVENNLMNTDDGKLAVRTMVLHKDSIGRTVGLVLALEDSKFVILPNWRTKSRVEMPCSFDIGILFSGDPAPSTEPTARFHVEATDWKSLRVVDWEVHMKRQEQRMRFVYAPLHSAVASMRLDIYDPQRRFGLGGTPHNPWNVHPEIMQSVIDVFTYHSELVENDRVWKGWQDNEDDLRKRDVWLTKMLYPWFDAIEEEYRRIDTELKARSSSS
jgi:hypothetical protein